MGKATSKDRTRTPGRSPRNLRRYKCMLCDQRLDRVAKHGCAAMYVENREACAVDGWESKLHSDE